MAEDTGQASEVATGLAGEETSQPSDAQGTTSPQNDEAVQFDATQRYQNPAKPEETITAAELKALVNQGNMFRDAQSTRDKAVAALQQRDALLGEAKARADKAEAQLQQVQLETPDMVLRRVEEVASQKWGDFDKTAEAKMEQIIAKRDAEEESQKRVFDFVNRARQVKQETLEAQLPDIPSTARDTILNLKDQVGQLDSVARDLVAAGDLDRADEAWTQSQGRDAEALRLHTEAFMEQQRLTADKQRREEVESLSKGGPEVVKAKKRTRKWRFGKEAEEDAEAKFEQAREIEKRIQQLNNY